MDSTDVTWLDATATAARIRAGAITSRACLELHLERIAEHNPALNAIVAPDFERARAAADAADRELAAGAVRGPLHGVPITMKESYDVAGLPTTFGNPAYRDNIAARSSDVAERLEAAGAIIMGKTNVPIALMDFQSYNEIYGTTHNPWDLSRSPGGSSGGESAALAAGLTTLGFGSDIGGSLRNPAHYTGIYSHKPTYGIVSPLGHSPVPSLSAIDLAVCGPMARSPRDLSLALDVIAGPDRFAAPGWTLTLPSASKPLSELRVAVWADDRIAPVTAEIRDRCVDVGERLARAGASVSNTARPAFSAAQAHGVYTKLLMAATSGPRSEEEQLAVCREAVQHDPAGLDRATRQAWNRVMPHHSWLALREAQHQIRAAWQAFFADWDVVLCPIGTTTAFHHDHSPTDGRTLSVDGVETNYFNQLFWAGLATLPYLPATAVPTGPGADGLPIGLQLIGAEYHDRLTLGVAEQLTEHGCRFQPPPI